MFEPTYKDYPYPLTFTTPEDGSCQNLPGMPGASSSSKSTGISSLAPSEVPYPLPLLGPAIVTAATAAARDNIAANAVAVTPAVPTTAPVLALGQGQTGDAAAQAAAQAQAVAQQAAAQQAAAQQAAAQQAAAQQAAAQQAAAQQAAAQHAAAQQAAAQQAAAQQTAAQQAAAQPAAAAAAQPVPSPAAPSPIQLQPKKAPIQSAEHQVVHGDQVVVVDEELVRSWSYNPAFFLHAAATGHKTAAEKRDAAQKHEEQQERHITHDAAPLIFTVPDGCDSIRLLYGAVESVDGTPLTGAEKELVIVAGHEKITTDGPQGDMLAPGATVVVVVPWRGRGRHQIEPNRVRVEVIAHFYSSLSVAAS